MSKDRYSIMRKSVLVRSHTMTNWLFCSRLETLDSADDKCINCSGSHSCSREEFDKKSPILNAKKNLVLATVINFHFHFRPRLTILACSWVHHRFCIIIMLTSNFFWFQYYWDRNKSTVAKWMTIIDASPSINRLIIKWRHLTDNVSYISILQYKLNLDDASSWLCWIGACCSKTINMFSWWWFQSLLLI